MLIKNKTLELIKIGAVSTVFRIWKRPTVKTGGFLKTRIGVLAIESVERIHTSDISVADLRSAGLNSIEEIGLDRRKNGDLYRIRLHYHGSDPRLALRNNIEPEQIEGVIAKLRQMGDWTFAYLEIIKNNPSVRAENLAEMVGLPKAKFKYNVRKLKDLGLTISLNPGYELSIRGHRVEQLMREQ